MCGIFGSVIGKSKELRANDFIEQAFITSSLRGVDASGIAHVNNKKQVTWQKLAIPGYMFMGDKWAQAIKDRSGDGETITMGHTRSTTTGYNRGHSGAHPFYVTDGVRELIGTHNGTLTGWANKEGAKDLYVDSEWALNHIFSKGKEAFKDFNGPYVFAWWDSDDADVLNIATNGERPIHIAPIPGKALYYASEAGMLKWLLGRNNITAEKILYLAKDMWYKFPIKNVGELTVEALPKVVTYTSRSTGGTHSHFTGAGRSTTSSTSSYSPRTVMQKLDALFTKIRAEKAKSGVQESLDLTSVTSAEIDEAVTLNIKGVRAEFVATEYDKKKLEMSGTVTLADGTKCLGVVRKVHKPMDMLATGGSPWSLNVVGVEVTPQATKEIIVICSKPRITALIPAVSVH